MKKLLCLFVAGTLFASCEKTNDDTTNTTPDPTPSAPSPSVTIPQTSASLIAIKSTSTINIPGIGEQTSVTGTAAATFNDGSNTSVSGGVVKCMGKKLSSQNGAYYFQPGFANPNGIDFSGSPIDWEVEGNGNVPGFSYSYMNEVPQIGGLSGINDEIDKSSDLTVTIDMTSASTDLSSADSLMFNVIDKNGKTLMVTTDNATTSHTFNASEMSTLDEGFAYVQVIGYNYLIHPEGTYDVAYINLGALTKNVTLK